MRLVYQPETYTEFFKPMIAKAIEYRDDPNNCFKELEHQLFNKHTTATDFEDLLDDWFADSEHSNEYFEYLTDGSVKKIADDHLTIDLSLINANGEYQIKPMRKGFDDAKVVVIGCYADQMLNSVRPINFAKKSFDREFLKQVNRVDQLYLEMIDHQRKRSFESLVKAYPHAVNVLLDPDIFDLNIAPVELTNFLKHTDNQSTLKDFETYLTEVNKHD